MVGMRKVCINAVNIQNAHMYNQQMQMSGDNCIQMEVPKAKYLSARFSFRPHTVMDWFIDPESRENDIIVFLQHRGELRFEYSPALETNLENVFSAF